MACYVGCHLTGALSNCPALCTGPSWLFAAFDPTGQCTIAHCAYEFIIGPKGSAPCDMIEQSLLSHFCLLQRQTRFFKSPSVLGPVISVLGKLDRRKTEHFAG